MLRTVVASPLAVLLSLPCAVAQELEPRAYSPSPVGTTFVVVSATRSSGGVFTDASVPIDDVEATVHLLGVAAGRTFGIAGKQALVLGAVPMAWASASGQVGEGSRSASRTGLADSRIRLSVILAGSKALPRADFARAAHGAILGSSVIVVAPTGQYDAAKLINLGSRRWAFKPEMGVSAPFGRWTVDAYGGVWLFTANDAYYPGSSTREQDPILALQGHVSYTFGRRSWLAVDATWYSGGKTTIDGIGKADLQRNTRLGATWAQHVGNRQSLKIAYGAGAATRIGADFRTITAAWQVVIF